MHMTEAEATTNEGRKFQPCDRVTHRYDANHRSGTVAGNRYFGGGVYGVLVLFDGSVYPHYVSPDAIRHAV